VSVSDEAMETAYRLERPCLLEKLSDWLTSEKYNLVYSSALCLGNVARTDAHCSVMVERGLHKLIIDAMNRDNCDMKLQHALLSTLR